MNEFIDIYWDPSTQEFVLDALGFKGPVCEKVLGELAAALGLNVASKTKKPEYHQTESYGRKVQR